VVEDSPELGLIIKRGLAEEGHAVDLEPSMATANHALDSADYDLVVLDLGLPDGDGTQLCRQLRSSGSAVPIIILTARDDLGDKVVGLDAGADDYLTKPFDFPELAARIRALLRRPAQTMSTVLRAGPLELDPAAHEVRCDGVLCPLTAREFALLEYLMRHLNEVVSRSDLIEHVWDANYDGLSNVVDVHVANLRRKFDDTSAPVIETVRGVGYRLPDPGHDAGADTSGHGASR
jgi:DNA-binding response OmpR family regulator